MAVYQDGTTGTAVAHHREKSHIENHTVRTFLFRNDDTWDRLKESR